MNPSILPKHVAIIMDGNGRWAKMKNLPRIEGHRRGVDVAETIITEARESKIAYLTLYAFSDENWKRPQEEVEALMQLLDIFLKSKQEKMVRNGIQFQSIGDLSKLPQAIQERIHETKEVTKKGRDLTLTLALSYGARNEIIRATQKLLQKPPEKMFEESAFSQYLDTKNFPDPDLLIRTSGEYRLSNFLLWQLAYTELYFTKVMWPDFTPEEFHKALDEYAKRERRFGKTSEQL